MSLLADVVCGLAIYFLFKDTASSDIYTLSLHDALPIFNRVTLVRERRRFIAVVHHHDVAGARPLENALDQDRKSTRLNSSHPSISYAVFCLKKKTTTLPLIEPLNPQAGSFYFSQQSP